MKELKGIARTKNWFDIVFPDTTDHQVNLQLGVHLEEVHELLTALDIECDSLHSIAEDLKHGRYGNKIIELLKNDSKRLEILDALADQIVTLIGTAHVMDMDLVKALDEVNDSNYSKFDNDGNPLYDETTGKVLKGDNYFKPDLNPFIYQKLETRSYKQHMEHITGVSFE